MKSSALGSLVFLLFFSLSCAEYENVIPKPVVSISNEMMNEWNGCLQGQAFGIEPHLYHLAVYAEIDGLWYSLPDKELPRTTISDENQWICQAEKLEIDRVAEVAVYLLPNRFNSPAVAGEKSLPVKLDLVAVAKQSLILKEEEL
jgi:hypothetical protein